MAKTKGKFVWSPDQIPDDYRDWVGYSPETFFDVNALALMRNTSCVLDTINRCLIS